MSALADELLTLEVLADEVAVSPETTAWERACLDILAANEEASRVGGEELVAFLELMSGSDPEYIAASAYLPEPPRPEVDWDAVCQILSESQGILIGVQNLLSETLAGMGVADHATIRVYADMAGSLRLVADHPRRDEIEAELNSPKNAELRTLYHAAVDGMSLAGGLVGAVSVPDEVLERVKAKKQHAA